MNLRRIAAILLGASACSTMVLAQDFRFSADGVGPITVSLRIQLRDEKEYLTAFPRKVAELTASARNESKQPIRSASFCVQAERRMKGCDFKLVAKSWEPGEVRVWTLDRIASRGIENPKIVFGSIKTDVPALKRADR
jgi:hypothetical protein